MFTDHVMPQHLHQALIPCYRCQFCSSQRNRTFQFALRHRLC